MKSEKRRGIRMKDNSLIDNACRIYSLTIKDNIEKVTSILNNIREMGGTMNKNTHNIIEKMIRSIFTQL